VRWNLSSGVLGVFVVDNELPTTFSGNFDWGSHVHVSVPGTGAYDLDSGQLVRLFLNPDDEPGLPPDFAGPDSRRLVIPGGAGVNTGVFLPRFFPAYIGDGSVVVSAGTGPLGGPPPGIAVLTVEPFQAFFGATLSYEFTPAPEPSAFVLAGLGLLAGAGVWRHRRSRA
jgi:hypothetical protein